MEHLINRTKKDILQRCDDALACNDTDVVDETNVRAILSELVRSFLCEGDTQTDIFYLNRTNMLH